MLKKLFLLAATLSCSVCSYAQNPQDEMNLCMQSLSTDPELAELKGKVGLSGVAEQTFEMKTLSSRATTKEKKAITLWVGKVKRCSEPLEVAATEGRLHPKLVAPTLGVYPNFEKRAIQLFDRKISYGEFARLRSEDYLAAQNEFEKAREAILAEQEHSRNEKERQENEQALARQEQDRRAREEQQTRCREARQNAATFCNQRKQDVTVNIGTDGTYSNRRGLSMQESTNSYNCSLWSGRATQECR